MVSSVVMSTRFTRHPRKREPPHNPKDTAKSHLIPLNTTSADEPLDVPVIVELVEKVPLGVVFLTVEFRRDRETLPSTPGAIHHADGRASEGPAT